MSDFERCIEATLIGVEVSKRLRSATFKIVDPEGISWYIEATGVEEMLLEEFHLYNIVDRVTMYNQVNPLNKDGSESLHYLLHGKLPCSEEGWSEKFQSAAAAIERGELKFFEIEAVYGAQAFILSETMSMSTTPTHL